MNDLDLTIGALVFMLGWHGLSKIVAHLSRRLQQSRVVWCARIKTLSLVETEPERAQNRAQPTVRRCLLWPEYHDCDQRCVRTKPLRFSRRNNASKAQ